MIPPTTPRGSPAEVMYQHQHELLPLEQLKGVPQPIVTLLEVLLDKDPAQRFQNPAELLKALRTLAGAIDAGRSISRQNLQESLPLTSRIGTRHPPGRLGLKKVSVARLPVTGSDVFGREEDIAFLDDAWANQQVNVVTIVAWAGVGKSTLVNHWLRRMAAEHYRSAQLVFGWSFYRQGTRGQSSSADEFLMPLSRGSEIQIHEPERLGRKAKDWRSSSLVVEPYWFWMGWSRSKIRLGHKKGDCVSLPSRRFCASLRPSIRGFA
jgi:hypothetical protein